MKKIKSFIAVLTVVIILLQSIFAINMFANASTGGITQSQAISWIKDKADNSWWEDVDGYYGCQCVDLIYKYYQYLGKSIPGGNARDFKTCSLPDGWTRSTTAQPGDIFSYGQGDWNGEGYSGTFGHVGLVYAVDENWIYTVETNMGGEHLGNQGEANAIYYKRVHNTDAYFIHPDFATEGKLATITSSAGGTVTFGDGTTKRYLSPGVSASLKVKPNTGYKVTSYKLNGVSKSIANNGGEATYWFPMPDSELEISVTFAKITYTATITSSTGGTAVFDSSATTKQFTVGAVPRVTVTPSSGYYLSSFTVNDVVQTVQNNGGAYEYWVNLPTNDTSLVFTFEKITYAATIASNSGGTAKFGDDSTVRYYAPAQNGAVYVTPDDGYKVTGYTLNGVKKSILNNGGEATYWFPMPDGELAINFTFSKIAYGDINGDGEINLADLVCCKKALVGLYTPKNVLESDVNVDGVFNILDCIRLKNYFAGKNVELGQ